MRYGLLRLTPGVRNLMVLTTGAWVLDLLITLATGQPLLRDWLGVVLEPRTDPARTWLQFWRPFTYTLVHQDFSHLLWNMVGLFFLGAALEESIGTARLYRVYVASGVAGALVAILAAWFLPGEGGLLIGASGAVMGTLFAFITLYPNETIMLWMLVLIPVRALYLGVIYFLIQFVGAFSGASDVSYFAHLGGLAAGVGMAHQGFWLDNLDPLGNLRRRWRRRHLKPVRGRRAPATLVPFEPPVRPPAPAGEGDLEGQVDAILDKVRQQGMDALTDSERRTLDLHSTRLRQRDHAG